MHWKVTEALIGTATSVLLMALGVMTAQDNSTKITKTGSKEKHGRRRQDAEEWEKGVEDEVEEVDESEVEEVEKKAEEVEEEMQEAE